jgi:hypothetical protein
MEPERNAFPAATFGSSSFPVETGDDPAAICRQSKMRRNDEFLNHND